MAKREKQPTQRKLWPLLIGAVFFGIVAALLAGAYLQSLEKSLIARFTPEQEQEVDVAVAAVDLERGSVVSAENFSKRSIPARFLHSDAITPGEFGQFEGRAITVPLGAGKALLRSHLDDDFPIDFSDIVDKGRRAITITVDEVNSIAGFIRPGNRIDLYVNIALEESGMNLASLQAGLRKVGLTDFADVDSLDSALQNLPEGVNPADVSKLFLPNDVIIPLVQDVRVLATGADPYIESLDQLRTPQPRRERNYSNLTLDVSAKQAAFINAALDKGEILALLRNRDDREFADFTSVSAQDLFSNAETMARARAEQASKVSAVAGVNNRGDVLDADGKILASKDALAASGFTVNKDGTITDADGNVVDPNDLIVTSDGKVMSRKQLAAAGLSVDADGRIVDAAGNVVAQDDVVVTKDGRILRKDQLAAAGLSVNEKGEIVDSTGRIIDNNALVVTKDGRVLTKEQLEQSGLSIDKDGNVVDKDGNIINADDLITTADGKVTSKQAALAQGLGTTIAAGVNAQGDLVDDNGNVLASKEQLAAAGYSVNANGQIVDKDGNVVDANDLVVGANGKVLSKKALQAAGLSVDENGLVTDAQGNVVDASKLAVRADGSIIATADGKAISEEALAAAGLRVDSQGRLIDNDGNVVDPNDLVVGSDGMIAVSADGKILSKQALADSGLRVDSNGRVVDANGDVVDTNNLVVRSDGSVVTRERYEREGDSPARQTPVNLVIGGASKDGVAKTTKLKANGSEQQQ